MLVLIRLSAGVVQNVDSVAVEDRDVTQNPRLKMAKRSKYQWLDVANVSHFIFESHGLAGVLLSRLIPRASVVFEDFQHKCSTRSWGEPLG